MLNAIRYCCTIQTAFFPFTPRFPRPPLTYNLHLFLPFLKCQTQALLAMSTADGVRPLSFNDLFISDSLYVFLGNVDANRTVPTS